MKFFNNNWVRFLKLVYSSFSASVSRPLTTTQSVSVLRRNLVPRFYSVLRLSLGRGDLGTRLPRRLRNFFQFRPCLSYWLTGPLNFKQMQAGADQLQVRENLFHMNRFKKLLQVLCCYLHVLGTDLKVLTIHVLKRWRENRLFKIRCRCILKLIFFSVVCTLIFEDSQKYLNFPAICSWKCIYIAPYSTNCLWRFTIPY